MKFSIGPEIINSYKRLSYTPWHALAEFVDNSTQSYLNNEELMSSVHAREDTILTVSIDFGTDFIQIEDNSIGMSESELEHALTLGKPPKYTNGRSRYGLGLKTAACWFGNYWSITTKKYGEDEEIKVFFDVNKVVELDELEPELKTIRTPKTLEEHYTIIRIEQLNRKLIGKTVGKIKDYLRSIYRIDIANRKLDLKLKGDSLIWNYEDEIFKRILVAADGTEYRRPFHFKVGGKEVKGWAGVFESGSKKDAGFSLIQANRVIKGWPDAERFISLFGDQEGGSNTLVNQRLVGEIFLDEFDVSHTKDEILFTDEEYEELDSLLAEEFADYKYAATTYRKPKNDERLVTNEINSEAAISDFNTELHSQEFESVIETFELPPVDLLQETNDIVKKKIIEVFPATIQAQINELEILIYLVSEMSPNDPYVLIESTKKSKITVIINKAHPHWLQIPTKESILNFIRHCVYDGVAEWKSFTKLGRIQPDTVKLFKDQLLRIPFWMEKHSD